MDVVHILSSNIKTHLLYMYDKCSNAWYYLAGRNTVVSEFPFDIMLHIQYDIQIVHFVLYGYIFKFFKTRQKTENEKLTTYLQLTYNAQTYS